MTPERIKELRAIIAAATPGPWLTEFGDFCYAVKNEKTEKSQERAARPASGYVTGWLTSRFERGETPNYGYPKNHLPETEIESINVKTGYLAKASRK